MAGELCSHPSGLYIYLKHTNQTRLSYAPCIQPIDLKLCIILDRCGNLSTTAFGLYGSLPNQINGSALSITAVMADFYNQGHHALVFSHSRLMYALKMKRYIVVVDYECGRGKIDNSSNTLSEATISS